MIKKCKICKKEINDDSYIFEIDYSAEFEDEDTFYYHCCCKILESISKVEQRNKNQLIDNSEE